MKYMENKIEYPHFIKVNAITTDRKTDKFIFIKVRINPIMISSYHEMQDAEVDGKWYKSTSVTVGGNSYYLAMPIEKVDEMMESLDRSFTIQFDE